MLSDGSNTHGKEIRIGVDGRFFESHRTGIGNYIFELCRALDRSIPHGRFYVYSQSPVEMPIYSDRWIMRHETVPAWRGIKSTLWTRWRLAAFCRRDRVEVFWGANALLPHSSAAPRRVATVHDLMYQVAPETMSAGQRWAFRLFLVKDLSRADAIVVNSYATAHRLENLLGLKSAAVVPPASSGDFTPAAPPRIARCLATYGIKAPYLLWVGDWSPRKNVLSLVRAFLALRDTTLDATLNLVLAGSRKRSIEPELARLIESNGHCIATPGYIAASDLPALYSGATAFVFPSTYEGYGMPVLEARACGTRVIASDVPELHEAGGEDTVYVEPTVEGIRAGIVRALAMPPLAGLDARPTWTDSARVLSRVLLGGAQMSRAA